MAKKNEDVDGSVSLILMTALAIGVMFIAMFDAHTSKTRYETLGKAICEEKYNLTYEKYTVSSGLKCKEIDIDNKNLDYYDGIMVELPEDHGQQKEGCYPAVQHDNDTWEPIFIGVD